MAKGKAELFGGEQGQERGHGLVADNGQGSGLGGQRHHGKGRRWLAAGSRQAGAQGAGDDEGEGCDDASSEGGSRARRTTKTGTTMKPRRKEGKHEENRKGNAKGVNRQNRETRRGREGQERK